jgi:hypothetical protein
MRDDDCYVDRMTYHRREQDAERKQKIVVLLTENRIALTRRRDRDRNGPRATVWARVLSALKADKTTETS